MAAGAVARPRSRGLRFSGGLPAADATTLGAGLGPTLPEHGCPCSWAGRFCQLQPAARHLRRNGLLSDLVIRELAAAGRGRAGVKTRRLAVPSLVLRSSMVKQFTLAWTTRWLGQASQAAHTGWYNTSPSVVSCFLILFLFHQPYRSLSCPFDTFVRHTAPRHSFLPRLVLVFVHLS